MQGRICHQSNESILETIYCDVYIPSLSVTQLVDTEAADAFFAQLAELQRNRVGLLHDTESCIKRVCCLGLLVAFEQLLITVFSDIDLLLDQPHASVMCTFII